MLKKSRKMHLIEIAAEYALTHGMEFELSELVQWAIDRELWEPRKTALSIGIDEFRNALKGEKDDDGVRLYLCASNGEQQVFWAHREHATWIMRQTFLDDQVSRVNADKASIEAMCQTLNQEREDGEGEFQLNFGW